MDNLSYPQPIKYWLHLCHRHRPHLFSIGTFLMGIGILVVLFHTKNTPVATAAAAATVSSTSLLLPDSIQHKREKRQTNQNSYEELQPVPLPLPSLQHKQSTSDLTVITAATRITITTTRSPSFKSIGNENVNIDATAAAAAAANTERWPTTKRSQNRKKKHQSIVERYQSNRQQHQRQNVENSRSMSMSVTRDHQQKHDTVSNENRHRYNSINNNIENNRRNDEANGRSSNSSDRNHIPKINNNNFSLRSNFTSQLRVQTFAGANDTINLGNVKRPLPLSSPLLLHRQQQQQPQFSNVKRKMYANVSISTRPNKNHVLVHGNDGYTMIVRKYKCIMCKVIPGEPMRRPSQSLNNKQWSRGMCFLCFKFCLPSIYYSTRTRSQFEQHQHHLCFNRKCCLCWTI